MSNENKPMTAEELFEKYSFEDGYGNKLIDLFNFKKFYNEQIVASQTPKEEPKPLTEDSCDLCKGMGAKYVGVPLGHIKCPKCGKY